MERYFTVYDHTLSSALFTLLDMFTPSAADRCRHFMIDPLKDGKYIILGENRCHRCLQDLVDFHRRTPIMPFTEVLTVACGQVRGIIILPCIYYQFVWFVGLYLLFSLFFHLIRTTLLQCVHLESPLLHDICVFAFYLCNMQKENNHKLFFLFFSLAKDFE